jgi:exoribonuclease II
MPDGPKPHPASAIPFDYIHKAVGGEFNMAKNPWLSLWLSAANTWTGAARGFWTAEIHRQRRAMLNELTRLKPQSSTKTRSSQKAASGVRRKAKG